MVNSRGTLVHGGRLTFTIDEIKNLVRDLRRVDPAREKGIRRKLRTIGFYISDFSDGTEGFTRSDVDELIQRGNYPGRRLGGAPWSLRSPAPSADQISSQLASRAGKAGAT